jgi:hypothetical protein
MKLNDDQLRRRIATLESELATIATKLGNAGSRSLAPFQAATKTNR